MEGGVGGHDLVSEVLINWESIVNQVAKREIEEKMIVCGRATKWWDSEILCKRELNKRTINGREDLWDEYCRLCKDVKGLVIAKKLKVCKEVVEKVNTVLNLVFYR